MKDEQKVTRAELLTEVRLQKDYIEACHKTWHEHRVPREVKELETEIERLTEVIKEWHDNREGWVQECLKLRGWWARLRKMTASENLGGLNILVPIPEGNRQLTITQLMDAIEKGGE